MAHCQNKYINKRPDHYLFIKIGRKFYRGKIKILDHRICNKFEYRCQMEVHRVDFDIPWKIAKELKKVTIINSIKNTQQAFSVHNSAAFSKPFNGILVCVPILYWYDNYVQMFLFLENWRRENNAKIILYYNSISPDVYDLIQYYSKTNLVELRPASQYPNNMNGFNLTHGMATKIFFNECLYTLNARYFSVMDIDEYFYVRNTKKNTRPNILRYAKNFFARHPTTIFINFESYHISYINTHIDDTFNFAKKAMISVDDKNHLGKSIMLTSKISHVGHHIPEGMYLRSGYRFPSNEAFLVHARENFIMLKRKKLPRINVIDYKIAADLSSRKTIETMYVK
uniref:Glycosyltransferase family 92 protein n=1 Tax=Parastrongyloides trichosuri TaxID=131310 RepID=A0A0N5A6L0_PARTI